MSDDNGLRQAAHVDESPQGFKFLEIAVYIMGVLLVVMFLVLIGAVALVCLLVALLGPPRKRRVRA